MKLFLIPLILMLPLFAVGNEDSSYVDTKRDSIVSYAQSLLGKPYLWGGTTPKGFDCSGFVYYVFSHFNIKVSRTSRGHEGKGKEVDILCAQPADIILFTGTDPSIRKIGHVGIVLKNENGTVDFIHSSSSKKHFGVTVSRYNTTGYKKRFMQVIDILK